MDNEWLKMQFRLCPDKNKAGLATALNLGAPAVSKILAGTRQIKASEYAQMRRYFGLPVDGEASLRGQGGDAERYVLAPMQQAGATDGLREKESAAQEQDSWVIPASVLKPRTAATPDKIRIFTVQESAMAPDFTPGEQVLVDLSDQKASPPGVFIVSDGIGHIIRRCEYLPHSAPPQVRLSTASGKFDAQTVPLKDAGLVGRVIAKLTWL